MSRSYKKNPISKDGGRSSKRAKTYANHSFRQNPEDCPVKGSLYRKHYESWDINDYVVRWSKEDAIKAYNDPHSNISHLKSKYPTLKLFLNEWEKQMVRK